MPACLRLFMFKVGLGLGLSVCNETTNDCEEYSNIAY